MNDDLVIRPARPADRPAMERICAHTWDWGDYLPEVWDDWLADPAGGLTVGEVDGRVIAVSKATVQPEGQVWLEGMRVDPDYRQQGIASRYLDYNLAEARRRGARVVRLSTGSHNTPVHKIMARAGMERVGVYVLWMAHPLPDGPRPTILTTNYASAVLTFVQSSPVLAHTHGLYGINWAWQELTPERVSHLLETDRIVAWTDEAGQVAALAIVNREAHDDVFWLGFADGSPAAVAQLATVIRGQAAQLGAARVETMLPDLPWLRDAFQAAGYGPGEWEGELWLFERQFDQAGGRLDR